MSAVIKDLVADDHPALRRGLIATLGLFSHQFQVVAEARDVPEALFHAAATLPDVVLTDLHFSKENKAEGIDLIRALTLQQPDVKCVVITGEASDVFLLQAHDAGAHAYLHKEAEAREIVRAIEAVHSGYTHFPTHLALALGRRSSEPKLTAREAELLPLIALGLTAKEIARDLSATDAENSLNDRTVEVHKGNIKRKFQLDSANALITFAIQYCQEHRIDYRVLSTKQLRAPR